MNRIVTLARFLRCLVSVLALLAGARSGGAVPPDSAIHWIQTIGSSPTYPCQANGVAVDPLGQVHVTGFFQYGAQAGGLTLTNQGNWDLFTALYDSDGVLLWVRTLGSVDQDTGAGIGADAAGNSYVAGWFNGVQKVGTNILTSAGAEDVVVVKYDPVGEVRWARAFGGGLADHPGGIAVDTNGFSYVTGFFQSTLTAGSLSLTAPDVNGADVFVARLDPDGNVLWLRSGGGAGADVGVGVAVDSDGGVFVTGSHGDAALFGTNTLATAGSSDMFLAKYDSAGTLLWVRSGGGLGADSGTAVAAVPGGGCIAAGTYNRRASFDTLAFTNSVGGSNGIVGFYSARYGADGSLGWVRNAVGPDSTVKGVVVRGAEVLMVGHFKSWLILATNGVTGPLSYDIFVTDMGLDGSLGWVRSLGSAHDSRGAGIGFDGASGFYCVGAATGPVSFDGLVVEGQTNVTDAYLAAFSPSPALRPPSPQGITVTPGTPVSFTISAVGAQPLFYQWTLNDSVPVPGGTNATLQIPSAVDSVAGLYNVTVTNLYGSVRSDPVNLNVFGRSAPRVSVDGHEGLFFNLTNRVAVPVSIMPDPPTAQVYYTVDGSAPSFTSIRYSGGFNLSTSATLRVIAYDVDSSSAQSAPVPVHLYVTPPVVSVGGQTNGFSYTNVPLVTVSLSPALAGFPVRYTLDGSIPDTNSLLYLGPFTVTNTVSVRASTLAPGMDVIPGDAIPVHLYFYYPVTLVQSPDGDTRVTPAPEADGTYLSESVIQFVAKARTGSGWSFLRWSGDVSGTNPALQVTVDRPLRVVPEFGTPLTVTNFGDGSVVLKPPLGVYARGEGVQAYALPAPGSYLDSWGGIGTGNTNPLPFKIQGPVPALSAQYRPLPSGYVSVAGAPTGPGRIERDPSQPYYLTNSPVTVKAVPDPGAYFVGWKAGASGTEKTLWLSPTSSFLLTAEFALVPTNQFFVDAAHNEHGHFLFLPPAPYYTNGSKIQIVAIPDPGYYFDAWAGDASGNANPLALTVATNRTLTGTFVALPPGSFSVVGIPSGPGRVSLTPAQTLFAAGSNVVATAIANPDAYFVRWTNRPSLKSPVAEFTVTTNLFLQAEFAAVPSGNAVVSLSQTGQGTATRDPVRDYYPLNSIVTLTAAPAAGNYFVGWGGAVASLESVVSLVVTGRMEITAAFAPIPPEHFSVLLSHTGGGSIEVVPARTEFPGGTDVTFRAVPAFGFYFDGWSGAFTGSVPVVPITVTSNLVVRGRFSPPPTSNVVMQLSAEGPGSVSVDPVASYYQTGTVVRVTATPDPEATFTGWFGGFSSVLSSYPITIPSTNFTLVGRFIGHPTEITLSVLDDPGAGSGFGFLVTGPAGASCTVQSAGELFEKGGTTWTTEGPLVLSPVGGTNLFRVSGKAGSGIRWYRVVLP